MRVFKDGEIRLRTFKSFRSRELKDKKSRVITEVEPGDWITVHEVFSYDYATWRTTSTDLATPEEIQSAKLKKRQQRWYYKLYYKVFKRKTNVPNMRLISG